MFFLLYIDQTSVYIDQNLYCIEVFGVGSDREGKDLLSPWSWRGTDPGETSGCSR